jgi:hemerythrin-like domain-containing protein
MRYNIFNHIHKALRALLYDTALVIQQTDFVDAAEAEQTLKKLQQIIALFDKHAYHEDNYVLPAIQKFEPALKKAFEQEHVQDHALGQRLEGLMTVYQHADSTAERTQVGLAIHTAYVEFMVFNLTHMAKEEDIINAALWKHYSDVQIQNLNNIIVSKIPQDELAFSSLWMIKSLNNQEIIGWLKQVRSNAPEPAFRALFNMAASELSSQRWSYIQEVLMEGVLVA